MIPIPIRERIIKSIAAGHPRALCASMFGCSTRTIGRLLRSKKEHSSKKKGKRITPGVAARLRTVRSLARVTTTVDDFIFRTHPTARAIQGELLRGGCQVSRRQVCRDLRRLNARSLVRHRVPTRQSRDFQSRLLFTKKYRKVGYKRWIFSDECIATANENTGRCQWCFLIRGGKREAPFPIEKKSRFNTASIQVWAAVGFGYKSPLIILPAVRFDEEGEKKAFRMNRHDYIRRCLSKVSTDLSQNNRIFVQDGSRAHDNSTVEAYLKRKGIPTAVFPPYSPDLNVIEQVWGLLKRRVGMMVPRGLDDLTRKLKRAWEELPQDEIDNLCRKYPRTLEKVYANEGRT